MEIIAYKGRPFSAFVDGFVSHFAQLQLYNNHIVLSFSKKSMSNRRIAAIFNLLMRSDLEDVYLKHVHSLADGQTVTKYSSILFPTFLTNRSLILCNVIFQYINVARSLGRC